MSVQRHWNLCLLGAALLVVLGAIVVQWTVPAILHRPGVPIGPLLICLTFALLLGIYGWWETRR